jgi:hypothetical protein
MDDKTAAEHGAWQAILDDVRRKLNDGTFQHDFSGDYEQWVTVKAEYRDGSGDAGSLQVKVLSIHWALQALVADDKACHAEVLKALETVPGSFLNAFLLATFQIVIQYDAPDLTYPALAVFREQAKARILDVLDEGSGAIRQLAGGFRASLTKPLLELFADPGFVLRSELPQLIGILRDQSGFRALVEAIEKTAVYSIFDLATVKSSVHALAGNFPCSETKPVLLRVLSDERRSAYIGANAIAALAKNCPDAEVVSAIVAQLTNAYSDIRQIAARELCRLGHPDIFEILLQQLRDPSLDVAEQAEKLLMECDSRDILPALKRMARWTSREKRSVKQRAKSIIKHLQKRREE